MLCRISLLVAMENHFVMDLVEPLKESLTTESLSRTKTSPIVIALQAYQFCKNTMPTLEFFLYLRMI